MNSSKGSAALNEQPLNAVLISTYELGRQPFGLASPAAWLRRAGASVTCLDLSRETLREEPLRQAHFIAFYVPMHTATRLAVAALPTVRKLNPCAHLCFYGLYAPVNETFLRKLGAETILGAEFEEGLVSALKGLKESEDGTLAEVGFPTSRLPWDRSPGQVSLARGRWRPPDGTGSGWRHVQREPVISLARQRFLTPDRQGLPALACYAHLNHSDGKPRTVGYTEASRGCKHLCRHCPIVPVYGGRFRVVQREVVLEDIRRQVAAGAQHITFGDPDFFNGIRHAMEIVRALHEEHPNLTYDVTIKIEHLLKHAEHISTLRDTGCLFVTSAVESVEDSILSRLDKGHTYADFVGVIELFRNAGLCLSPTFVAFTPWTTLDGYCDLLERLAELDLIERVAPIQLAIRLLIPAGSRLLELAEVRDLVGPFDEAQLVYPWKHSDPRVDELCRKVQERVQRGQKNGDTRWAIFERVWKLAHAMAGRVQGLAGREIPEDSIGVSRATIPYLTEPWYC